RLLTYVLIFLGWLYPKVSYGFYPLVTPLLIENTVSVGRTSVRHLSVGAAVVGLKPNLRSWREAASSRVLQNL
ncbi:hypothetical protein, partial [Thiolapillus sp.]